MVLSEVFGGVVVEMVLAGCFFGAGAFDGASRTVGHSGSWSIENVLRAVECSTSRVWIGVRPVRGRFGGGVSAAVEFVGGEAGVLGEVTDVVPPAAAAFVRGRPDLDLLLGDLDQGGGGAGVDRGEFPGDGIGAGLSSAASVRIAFTRVSCSRPCASASWSAA